MLSRDPEEDSEDDIEGLGNPKASAEEAAKTETKAKASNEETKGAEDGEKQRNGQFPKKTENGVQRLRENVT